MVKLATAALLTLGLGGSEPDDAAERVTGIGAASAGAMPASAADVA